MQHKKIGTFFGVIVPNITMMFGVILFLRLGVVTAHAGLGITLATIGFGLVIMLLTSASIAAIVSNMEVGAGGVYYLVTRSLGIEVGGALGYAIYLSQLLSISLTTSGFAYTLIEIVPEWNVVWVEVITLTFLMGISSLSASAALKFQGVILAILLAAVGAVFYGSPEGMSQTSSIPFYAGGFLSFWAAFALLYPALTGIEAGMALSGNLKDPSHSLMYGNAISLIFVALTYASLVGFAHAAIPDANLLSDPFSFVEYANPTWLVMIGICTATLSSAMGSLLGAPRILQSMASDAIVHKVFAKGYGVHHEPIWALLLTTGLALFITITTSIDQIIPILTMICLFSYGLLNIIAGLSALMNAPSWRPKFRLHYGISLFGALLCFITMFMISAGWSIIAILTIVAFYLVLRRKAPAVQFDDFRNSILFFISRLALYRLSRVSENALTWHPKVLVLTRLAPKHEQHVHFAQSLTRQSGLLTFATVVPDAWSNPDKLDSTRQALEAYFRKENIECLIEVQTAENEHEAFFHLVRAYGIGQIQPNTIMLNLSYDEGLAPMLIETIYQCYLSRKNVILLEDHDFDIIKSKLSPKWKKRRKSIDLWWNAQARSSFDLMISYITILSGAPDWENTTLNLKALAPTAQAKESLETYLNEFVKNIRIELVVQVFENQDFDEDKPFNLKYSREAGLVVMPIIPMDEETTLGSYQEYMVALREQNSRAPCVYIACYDSTEHREIYRDPLTEIA